MKAESKKKKVTASVLVSEHAHHTCGSCDGSAKSTRRDFSDQAWAALVAWSEVSAKAVDAPLCNDCYFNFRDVLIERADELRLWVGNVAANAKSSRLTGAMRSVARA